MLLSEKKKTSIFIESFILHIILKKVTLKSNFKEILLGNSLCGKIHRENFNNSK